MATSVKRKQWNIPPSYDVGVQFYYRNLLAGSDYVQAYLREHIAEADRTLTKHFETLAAGRTIEQGERPQYGYFALIGLLEDAGVEPRIISHITDHISHMAGGIGKNLDYFRVREFLAYCGIDGIYDLKTNKHIQATRKVNRIPVTIDPEKWRAREDAEEVRRDIAFLMDKSGRVAEISKEISLLDNVVWGEFVTEMTKDLVNNPPVGDIEPQRRQYLVDRPHLAESHAQLEELAALKLQTIEDLKDRYAPMDPAFKLPALGIEFDKDWYDKGDAILGAQKPFRQKFDKQMAALGKKKGDPEYDAFDWQKMRIRTFALFDWAIRDFTMNKVNRGIIADNRRDDIPRRFVQAVKDEIKDGMLESLGFPYRLEAVSGKPDTYSIICNECVAETFTLDSVLELDKQLIAEDVAKEAKNPKPKAKAAPQPVKPEKPVKSAEERELEWATRIKRQVETITSAGNVAKMTFRDAQGNVMTAAEGLAKAEAILAKNEAAKSTANKASVAAVVAVAEPAQEPIVDSPVAPVAAIEETGVAEPEGVESGAKAEIQAPVADHSVVDPAVAELVAEPVAEQVEPALVAPAVVAEDDDSELPFPGAGVVEDGALDSTEPQLKTDSDVDHETATDAPAIEFGNVAPDLGTGKVAEPRKTADKTASVDVSGKDNDRAPAGGKAKASEPDAKKDFAPKPGWQPPGARNFNQQPGGRGNVPQQQSGGGGGYSSYGGAGRGFSPQNLHVDFGIAPVIHSLRDMTGKFIQSLRPTGVNVSEATDTLSTSLVEISALKISIAAGVDEAGQPMTEAAQIAKWTELNQQLAAVHGQLKTLKKFPHSAMNEDTPKHLKSVSKELGAVAELAKANIGKEGILGELAMDAKKSAEQIVEALMKIIKSIMNVFSRSKSPSLE